MSASKQRLQPGRGSKYTAVAAIADTANASRKRPAVNFGESTSKKPKPTAAMAAAADETPFVARMEVEAPCGI